MADHIDPVTPTTSDAAFFDKSRIRASCREHNLARALLDDHELSSDVIVRDYTKRRGIY